HQKMIDFYHTIAQKSAQHHLMLNLHSACKPTGIRKTYPHILTREAVMGLKYSKWSHKITPEHNLTIPFTRMLAGPIDYSTGGFDNVLPENFKAQSEDPMVMGTRCHHLAMYVIFNSPLQMVSDHPSAYFNERGLEFIKEVPVYWDNTIAIDGKIGDYIIMAREHNKHWYIGAMTDTTARSFHVPLKFLEKNNSFTATIFKDNQWSEKNPKALDIQTIEVNSTDTLQINMAPGGGYAAYISPVENIKEEE
ncbi:MAG: glycoside hydrolase family 97 catalytic domain-containing protein, partial [Bacteroidota bacterium]